MPDLSVAFSVLARDSASRNLDKVGDAAQRTGKKVEEGSGRGRSSFALLGQTLRDSSQGALGPIADLADKIGLFNQAVEQGGGGKSAKLFGAGLAAGAVGAGLLALHGKEQSALQQVQASVEATGHSFDDYRDRIEKAAASGAKFGDSNTETLDALNRLTLSTHSPEEAMKGLSIAFDVAAAKHIPLTKAADLLGLAYNGSVKAGKQFGVVLENVGAAGKALPAAMTKNAEAVKAARDAQTSYSEKLAEWNANGHKTLTQAYALRDAHTRLVEAQDKAKTSADHLKDAQQKAGSAADGGARNFSKIATVVKDQGTSAADSFTGELKKLRAEVENTLGAQGTLGKALAVGGPILAGLTGLAQTAVFLKVGKSFKTLRDIEVLTSEEGTASIVGNAAIAEGALAAEGAAAEGAAAKFGLLRGAAAGGLAGIAAIVGGTGVYELNKHLRGSKLEGPFWHGNDPISDFLFGPQAPKVDPKDLGDTNAGDDKLAMQRLAHVADSLNKAAAKAKPKVKASGDDLMKTLLDQLNGQAASDAAKQAATDAAQNVVDAIGAKFQAASSRLQGLVSNALSLRSSVTQALQGGSALTDVFQGPDLNANGAFGHQNNFGRLRDFLQRRVAQERRFVLELRSLIKQGLDPSLVAQIASAGVDGGQRIAEAILSGGKGGIGQVNTLERQIASLANTTGKTVADQRFGETIKAARHNAEYLGYKLDRAEARLAAIQKNTAGSGSTTSSLVGTAQRAGV